MLCATVSVLLIWKAFPDFICFLHIISVFNLGSFETPSLPFRSEKNSFYENMSSLNCWTVADAIERMWSG